MFDLDGTLIDTMSAILHNYAETIRLLGGPRVSRDDVLAKFHVAPTPVLLSHFLDRSISHEELDRYYAGYEAAIAGLKPFSGVLDMLTSLGQEGYRLGLFTSAARRAVNLLLAKTALAEDFDVVVAGDEVTQSKPAPEGLHLACRKLGAHAYEAAYVGDSDVDLECAKQAGAFGIQAAWGLAQSHISRGTEIADDPSDAIELLRRQRSTRS